MKIDLETHVYCMDCVRGELLLNAIENYLTLPKMCETCYYWDMEDSAPFELRKMYEPK